MDLMTNIIVALKERAVNNNHIKYLDGMYDLDELLKYLNINKKECTMLYVTNIMARHIESKYNIETQSIMKAVLNNKAYFMNNNLAKDNKTYIIEDCNILDLKTFNELLSMLPKEAKIVLIGDRNMISTLDNNVFDLALNVVAQKYLEKIKLEKDKRVVEDNPNIAVIAKDELLGCEDYAVTVHDSKSFSKPLLSSLIKINDDLYSGIVNWSDLKKLLKANISYELLEKGLNTPRFAIHSIPYLKRFIENPYIYFQKTVIMSTESELNDAISKGVVTSNFLNTYYYMKIEDAKEKFLELECPSFKEITKLNLPSFDKRIMILIERQFREKYGSWKDYFKNEFFSMISLDMEIVLNQDKNYIFEYTLVNPDASIFIKNKDIIRLSTLKCYSLLDLKELNKDSINNLSSIDCEPSKDINMGILLNKYNNYDNELEIICNTPYSIYNLINYKELNEQRIRFSGEDKLLASDLGLSISHIENIINFKFDMIDIVTKKYKIEGLNLIFKGREESFLFNSIFRAINKNSYKKDMTIKYNLNKMCKDDLSKIKKEFINAKDILHLDEFLEIKKELKSGIYDKSIKLLEYGFIDLLNDKNINWQEIKKEHI